jgi:hypothetical protein
MLMNKLSDGVLRVLTPLGPRYVRPTLAQRLHLVWIFRHFEMLPLQVLSQRQRALIDTLCIQQQFLSLYTTSETESCAVIGTVERRPPVEVETLPLRRPNARVTAADVVPATGSAQQRS